MLSREENGQQISIFFDCANAGLTNMDIELVQFMIGVFKDYVPDLLNYILIFQMPWVLNGMKRGFIKRVDIQGLLPSQPVSK